MDSVTQAALGAAIGEAFFGKKIGNKALLWGIGLGTLPDLDIIAHFWLPETAELSWHRGLSHSLFFLILITPLLGWVLTKIHSSLSFSRASLGVLLILITHSLLDCFNVYGTQIFEPFSSYRVAFNNFSIIDPLYTLPLLLGIVGVLFQKKDSTKRQWTNLVGIILSTCYVAFSFGAKYHVDGKFRNSLNDQDIPFLEYQTSPSPLNTILWRCLVRDYYGDYWIGYYSLLDKTDVVKFHLIPKNYNLIAEKVDDPAIQKLIWFSKGYYTLTHHPDSKNLLLCDLRFGEIPFLFDSEEDELPEDLCFVFNWELIPTPTGYQLKRDRRTFKDHGGFQNLLSELWTRMKGKEAPVYD